MKETELVYCKGCRDFYEAYHSDIATYSCPGCGYKKFNVNLEDAIKKLNEVFKRDKSNETNDTLLDTDLNSVRSKFHSVQDE